MRRVLGLLAAALLLAGCGQAVDFEGDPEIPEGYATYKGQGFSFAHPKLPQKADDERVQFGDEKAFVEVRVDPGETPTPRDFDVYVRSYVALAEGAGRSEVEVTEQEVPRADAARLMKVTGPEGLKSRILAVDRGKDLILLSAGTRSGGGSVDADAVVSSFRLR
jgi:hypothetical protein